MKADKLAVAVVESVGKLTVLTLLLLLNIKLGTILSCILTALQQKSAESPANPQLNCINHNISRQIDARVEICPLKSGLSQAKATIYMQHSILLRIKGRENIDSFRLWLSTCFPQPSKVTSTNCKPSRLTLNSAYTSPKTVCSLSIAYRKKANVYICVDRPASAFLIISSFPFTTAESRLIASFFENEI